MSLIFATLSVESSNVLANQTEAEKDQEWEEFQKWAQEILKIKEAIETSDYLNALVLLCISVVIKLLIDVDCSGLKILGATVGRQKMGTHTISRSVQLNFSPQRAQRKNRKGHKGN